MNILEFTKDNLLFLDGGMGTLLQSQGLKPGELPETWNLTHPEIITRIHRDYFDAGSNVVNTNTFGASCLKFSREELDSIVRAAVENARKAARESTGTQPKWVALDIGPLGRLLKPYGDLDFEEAVSVFAETVRLGTKYGADLIFIETMNDSYETKAALLSAKENSSLPVFVSNAYGEDGKLMTGASPAAMIAMLEGMGADAIGVNCSLGPKALAPVVEEYLKYASVPVLLKPNAGLPRAVGEQTVFDVTPDEFADDVAELLRKGVRIAGGCCGTTPAYLYALTAAAADVVPVPVTVKHFTMASSYTHAVVFGDKPVFIGERINPTGKKRFREALRAGDMDYILKEGIAQEEQGAHILDVNVGLPEIDETTMLTNAVCALQAISNLPLQIDTSDPTAMESALRRYNGKAMVNSVNGKRESMDAVFPLVKKYGGLVVALTLDASGIPETADGRLSIARSILETAESYGISGKDIIFDPLALTVSADPQAALQTLEAVRRIRRELGCHTSLGVSNVSFGLPQRDILNGSFFTLALANGLSAAIANPFSQEIQKAYHGYCALMGLDENCQNYIAFAQKNTDIPAAAAPSVSGSDLHRAIVKGLKEPAAAATVQLLSSRKPLDLVQEEIIPALNAVGMGFESKTVYLPQLLMSAEAAKAAFEQIKAAMPADSNGGKCSFVLATVQGDIHDIGKNIVRLLLENYGFDVCDLGRDVAPEVIVRKVTELRAPIVGLSALMTTTVPAMEETIRQLRIHAPWCRIMVGGAVLNPEYAAAIGADHYTKDAMEAVRCAEAIFASLPR
ncbi:MAG: homocysteine S-methyltransferase family protein [Oscillospiraceae bacterium]|nr:homocysteine S-methyltransferase family protein [Oscillospiraceae bacterium]MBQ7130681.1 homocysteine S-methyltransferase family protein [Oscillospiraceae bacterium]